MQLAVNSHPLAGPPLVSDIDLAGRILADQHGSQARGKATVLDEAGHLFCQFRLDLVGNRLSVENSCCHDYHYLGGSVEDRKPAF